MSSLTTRVTAGTGATVKGSPLTNAEIDANFINLNVDKQEVSNCVSTNTVNTVVKRDSSGNFAANVVTVNGIQTGSVTYPTTNVTQAQMEAGTDTTTRYMSPNNVKQAIDILAMQSVGATTKDMTGFESLAGSTLAYVDATRIFTLSTSTSYNVWYRGKKSTISSTLSITLTNTPGAHYIGINPTSLTLEEVSAGDTIFTDTILVAVIYLNTSASKAVIVGDERHAASRDTDWHKNAHNNFGAMWRSGGAMTYTLNSDTATTVSLTSPIVLADEDLVHSIVHNPSPSGYFSQILTGSASIPTIYMNGTSYDQTTESTTPWVAGTATARINPVVGGTGSLSDAGDGKYLNYWILATNDIVRPIKALMGRAAYSTLSDAFGEQFSAYDLPFLEVAPMYQVTLLTRGTFAGNKVQIVNVKTLNLRQSAVNQNLKTISHAELASLGSDDHSQYVHISNSRTITAAHTFNGNNTFGGTQAFNILTATNVGSSLIPTTASGYDLGSTTYAWRHVYTSDLHLSNEKHESGNVVDGTRGNWTIQEGEESLYIINNKNGKRYKFNLEEV